MDVCMEVYEVGRGFFTEVREDQLRNQGIYRDKV